MAVINPQKYLFQQDDGLPLRTSGSWAEIKLDYLNRYLDIFTSSMKAKPWRSINYIDLFSGPGKCKIRDTKRILLGSPLLSLGLTNVFDKYFFVDSNQENIDSLKKRCCISPLFSKINFYLGDCNNIISQIINEIEKIDKLFINGKWSSLNIAFLDPEGLELEWSTIELLGKMYRMDLVIYYPQFGLEREMGKEIEINPPTKIDTFFGDSEWRDLYKKWKSGKLPSIHLALMSHIQDKLTKLGYVDIKDSGSSPLMRNKKRNAPLYRLMLESKDPLGKQFWQEVIKRDVHGQLTLY
jgi:three-Cys-motif partner protein